MTDQPILRSRTAVAVAPMPTTVDETATALDVALREATSIAAAGSDVLPPAYRGKPGAVLLVAEWARARGLVALEAIQSVSFVQGRPIIDAKMQRALAKRAGYSVRITDVSAESATVEVREAGDLLGSATYTLDDAKAAELLGKANWKKHPQEMLVARATTRAISWHAPDALVGVFVDDEIDTPDTVLATATVDTPQATADDEPADAEIVDEPGDIRSVIARLREQMTDEQRGEVRAFMGERGLISFAAADDQDLDAIAGECARILGVES